MKVIRPAVSPEVVSAAFLDAKAGMAKRLSKHGPGAYVDGHHALGIITEEWKELVDALQAGDKAEIRKEFMDVAVAALFAVASMDFLENQDCHASDLVRLPLRMADEMTAKLLENRHKGDREGWLRDSPMVLMDRVIEEAAELREEIGENKPDAKKVWREAADVANMAMMVADSLEEREKTNGK